MKITIDIDMTPQELREFLGLPNIEKLQQEFVKNAEKYLKDSSSGQYGELVAAAMQPMMAYQEWLQKIMTGGVSSSRDSRGKTAKGADNGKED